MAQYRKESETNLILESGNVDYSEIDEIKQSLTELENDTLKVAVWTKSITISSDNNYKKTYGTYMAQNNISEFSGYNAEIYNRMVASVVTGRNTNVDGIITANGHLEGNVVRTSMPWYGNFTIRVYIFYK